ncbi:MAG: hypothetical protein AAGG75_21895, partial [Bacteroidota bacterium]
VSILIFLDHARQQGRMPPNLCCTCVSILIFLDHARQPTSEVMVLVLRPGFNPNFSGSRPAARHLPQNNDNQDINLELEHFFFLQDERNSG